MTAPQPTDVLRAFRDALTPAARAHLRDSASYDQYRLITAACDGRNPADIARIISAGITRTTPANPAALIRYRLEREAGMHRDDNDHQKAGD